MDLEGPTRPVCFRQLAAEAWGRAVREDCDPLRGRERLLQNLKALRIEPVSTRRTGNIAVRPGKAGSPTKAHGIRPQRDPDNRNGICCLLCRRDRGRAPRGNYINVAPDEIGCEPGEALGVPGRVPGLDDYVLAVDMAEVAKSIEESTIQCTVAFRGREISDLG